LKCVGPNQCFDSALVGVEQNQSDNRCDRGGKGNAPLIEDEYLNDAGGELWLRCALASEWRLLGSMALGLEAGCDADATEFEVGLTERNVSSLISPVTFNPLRI